MFIETRGGIRIAFGYALAPDGLWRQHSWGVDAEDGRIVETTVRRVCYYGFVLNGVDTLLYLGRNSDWRGFLAGGGGTGSPIHLDVLR
jgi:hypothetical protein